MAEETDGVREAFDDALRIALIVATQLGERVARLREQFARQREARAVQTHRELEARFEAERGAMRASLLPVKQEGWWQHATVTDIANARETAVAWSDYDDAAREANDTIEREIHNRYGINAADPSVNPAERTEALRTAESERAQAVQDRQRNGQELAAADLLLLAADRRDREATRLDSRTEAAQPDYDSEARRDEFASHLVGVAGPETIAARILADGENARHPKEATRRGDSGSSKVKRGVGFPPRQQVKDRSLGR